MTRTLALSTLSDHVGQPIGVSEWLTVTQDRITAFAEVTDDRQWIHVDPARARAESAAGTTIAHGFLTLSLVSTLLRAAVSIEGVQQSINYGLDRVRFVSPVKVGARIRGHVTLKSCTQMEDAVQVGWHITVEQDGGSKPAMVAEWLVRYYG